MSMNSLNTTGLTELQKECASLLAIGYSKTDAAKECNIDRDTIYHWLKIPEFLMLMGQHKGQQARLYKEMTDRLAIKMMRGWNKILDDIGNRNYGKISELICKIKGMTDQQQNIAIIILSSFDALGQVKELMQQVSNRLPLLSEEEQAKLITDSSDQVECQPVNPDVSKVECPYVKLLFERIKAQIVVSSR